MDSKGLYLPKGTTFLFGTVPLETLGLAELTHVLAISMLGLLEPLRYGSIYPGRGWYVSKLSWYLVFLENPGELSSQILGVQMLTRNLQKSQFH